jgi:type II restriction/modification system DNA methylase subunit YeeA
MTPAEFIRKWKNHALTERASAQEHFLDLCRLVGHGTPAELDKDGSFFTFEKGVPKTGGGDGFADVWYKGRFAWEYKKKKRDLGAALLQLTQYAAALENPPLHVVCDTVRFRIETRWTNTIVIAREFELADIGEPENLRWLHAVFHDPEALRPNVTRQSLTEKAAKQFQTISDRLQHRNPDREAVAHFVNQLVFCFFANSVGLLPEGLLRKLIETSIRRPERSKDYFDKLFTQMESGGELDLTEIKHFNGGLFDGRRALVLDVDELALLLKLHTFRWDLIDPTIFGTLFERFLDPDKRAQIGAHYTDVAKIMKIVDPVVLRPLKAEWERVRAEIEAVMAPALAANGGGKAQEKRYEAARARAEALRDAFIDRLCALRILDPACGSGNFLYVALQEVKNLEWRALLDCETLTATRPLPRVGPAILRGIEINPFAAELARTVIWIGAIQWGVRNGLPHRPEPILEKLDTIECRDALIDWSGQDGNKAPKQADWPNADFIIGNPPFLGGKKLRAGLGDAYVETLFSLYDGAVPREADLVCYWFHRARIERERDGAKAFGLVATNSIRGGKNRAVLEPLAKQGLIFEAWADEPWVVDGAAVRVSLVCAGQADGKRLDGADVSAINADLSGAAADLTTAQRLKENAGVAFMGITKGAPFEVPRDRATSWIALPLNPNGRPNSDVLRPIRSGGDIVQSRQAAWVVDFSGLSEEAAALYQEPFEYCLNAVKPIKSVNKRVIYRERWWHFSEARPGLRNKTASKNRYIVTPKVAKFRPFVWFEQIELADNVTICIANDSDAIFGVLSSLYHETWALRLGAYIGVGNDPTYTPTTTFETFPFPEGLTPNIKAADYDADPRAIRIAAAAKRLDDLRRAWLNPPDLGDWVPEITPTAAPGEAPRKYPDRFVAKDAEAAAKLKQRTLTNLYNQRPQWLADAHAALDRAVAAAYGWPEDIATDDALARLLALNLERAAAGR